MAIAAQWLRRLQEWHRPGPPVEDPAPYLEIVAQINQRGQSLAEESDDRLAERVASLRARGLADEEADRMLIEVFGLVREAATRALGMRPFDVQVVAGLALHQGKLVEMQTGEGKTLAAVLPACLNALSGRGVHVLTFNDYLARRDAAWMGPVYRMLGLTVAAVQDGMRVEKRQAAYGADVTYATAREAGFDFLRMHLCRDPASRVHRPFSYAIVDEADSILIDEARVPLVIAGDRPTSEASPYRIAEVVGGLNEEEDWETDENGRNAFLTEAGFDRVEGELGSGSLHESDNHLLLSEVDQALHARVLLRRDVDYIVRGGRIELVDEFTGRVVDDRRWPDGLQAALEAKEELEIQPGGRILGSVSLQHFLKQYPKLGGMTATACPAAEELGEFYGLKVVPIPPNRPCVREDLPDAIFTHREAKHQALGEMIGREHARGRPILVGTGSVEESELLAGQLRDAGIESRVLNAKNDEEEAGIISRAGAMGAVTISTNMAGRGTDIRLGGVEEEEREAVVELGGLYVIGTNRHESRRIDDQLRGRAGRQGDPGTSRFYISLEDDLMTRFGIDDLIPAAIRPKRREKPVENPVIRREAERLQRIVEGQNFEIRKTLWRYSSLVEAQRGELQEWRTEVLMGEAGAEICEARGGDRYRALVGALGENTVRQAARIISLHHIDECWSKHLALVNQVREGIHLVGIGGLDPLHEFRKQIVQAFWQLRETIEGRIATAFATVEITSAGIDLEKAGLRGPSSTWTYLVNDRALGEIQQMLLGRGNMAFAPFAAATALPFWAGWQMWRRMTKGKD